MFKQNLRITAKKHGKLPKNCGSFCRVFFFALSLLFVLGLTGCSSPPETMDYFAMDTYIETTAYGKNAADFLLAVNGDTVRLESVFSAHSEKSELYLLNTEGEAPSEELRALIAEAISISELTEGNFDPTLFPVSRLWSFGGGAQIPSAKDISAALSSSGYEKVSITPSGIDLGKTEIDLGGIAKGYAADRFVSLAEEFGIESAMGSFGGMVAVVGTKPGGSLWKIGMRDPSENGYAAILNVSDVCISTSGAYERYFTSNGKVYHHILDPENGYPAESDLLSVTVIDESGTRSDALSTALFVMGESKAAEFCAENGICAIFITNDGRFLTAGGAEKLVTQVSEKYVLVPIFENK